MTMMMMTCHVGKVYHDTIDGEWRQNGVLKKSLLK